MWFESSYCYIHSMDLLVKFALLQMARAHLVEKCTLSQYCYFKSISFNTQIVHCASVMLHPSKNWPSLTMGCGTSPEHKIPCHRSGYPVAWGPHTGHLLHSSHPHCGRQPPDVSLLYHTHWSTANIISNIISSLMQSFTMLMFMLMQFKYLVLYRWTKYGNESWPLKQNTHTQIAWSQLSMIEHLTM